MADKYTDYRAASTTLPAQNRVWPLYGAGFDNLGQNGNTIDVPMPKYGPDELLVRHDACGLCFSDIKVIDQGDKHPRIFKDMKKDPVVLGHEVVMTVVGVGENLKKTYRVGDRFIIQADIIVKGVGYAYGYMIQGGLSKYGVIDQRILNGDGGNYLMEIQQTTGYVESALAEPWACVVAAYCLEYRTSIKKDGVAWFVGAGGQQDHTIGAGFDASSHPSKIVLSNVPAKFAAWLKQQAASLKIDVVEAPDIKNPPIESADDTIVLGAVAEIVEAAAVERAARDAGLEAHHADRVAS